MISLKMWCLLPLTILSLMSITPTVTEVVQSMSGCGDFLLENRSPQIPGIIEKGKLKGKPNQYKIICQTYGDTRRFVTLYDTENKIPVFSAYKYKGTQGGHGEEVWKIEPQLENMKNNKNMQVSDNTVYNKQASNSDYNNRYTRGHLFPKSFAFGVSDKTSTFTLTNAVPQDPDFNKGRWAKMERCVQCVLERFCRNGEAYVVTGAKPGRNNINNRVNIPSMLWSAFCCNDGRKMWLASAFWGLNVPDKSNSAYMPMRTLEDLYDKLSSPSANVFPGQNINRCLLNKTAHDRYPKMRNNCPCRISPAYEEE